MPTKPGIRSKPRKAQRRLHAVVAKPRQLSRSTEVSQREPNVVARWLASLIRRLLGRA